MAKRRRATLGRPDVVRERQAAANVIAAKRDQQLPLPERLLSWAKYPAQRRAFETLMRERFAGFPWLAGAWADYIELQYARESAFLAAKKWPAPAAAALVRELGQKAAIAEARARSAEYLLAYYEELFPFLVELRADDASDVEPEVPISLQTDEPGDDPAMHWLTTEEYRKLPSAAKYQLALDRYWSKRKTRWEIGRDYERYVGYLYEMDGFTVKYQGILEGFADFGRDLIATKREQTEVVQCKYWAEHRIVHEKHVFQLLGTAMAYQMEHPTEVVSAVFVTSTSLSERARAFASQLNEVMPFVVRDMEPRRSYPCIKCNVSRRSDERIYHLPFDQQYDAVVIEDERLERFVSTVAEAEELGFRRAKRWKVK